MFRIMRSFWGPTDKSETRSLKRRRTRSRKKRKNKANLFTPVIVEEANPVDSEEVLSDTRSLFTEEQMDENRNKEEENETTIFYQVEINDEEYQYMVENDLIEEQTELIDFENDASTSNLLRIEKQPVVKKKEKKWWEIDEEELERKRRERNKWWLTDEEFDENFELTDEQKLKCAAFFVWIIALVIFFYFHTPDNKDASKGGHTSSMDRIKEMTRNRGFGGGLPHSKFFPGMGDDAEQLSDYFDRNHRHRSPYRPDDPRFGASGFEDESDGEESYRRKMKRKRKVAKQETTKERAKEKIKRILWWSGSMPEIYKNKKIFEYYKCEKANCEFLDDRSRLKESIGVVFDYYRINRTDLPKTRRKNQLHIFYSEEAPQTYEQIYEFETKNDLHSMKFNLSWSFTLDSSVQLNAGNLILHEKLINENLKAQLKILSKSKIKDCLIIVSNACKTIKLMRNGLVSLVDDLSGATNSSKSADSNEDNILSLNKLNSLKLKSVKTTNYEQHLLDELIALNGSSMQFDLLTNCNLSNNELKNLINNYRFALIIENEYCQNYQENEVYLALEANTIPILNNNFNQYKLPHKSIINLNEYGTMNDLVNYLKTLKSNFSKYYSHLKWKRYFKVTYKKTDICDLCDLLNKISNKNRKELTIDSFTSNTWKLNAACFTYDRHNPTTSLV